MSFASRIACCGIGGVPFRVRPTASTPSNPARANRMPAVISSASQGETGVANAAAIEANRHPGMNSRKRAGATPDGNPSPSPTTLRWRPSLCARLDQARLQLAEERSLLRERLRELRLRAALGGGAICQRLQLVREAFHLLVTRRHFFVGGSSPVSVRQILEAARRETTVAIAPVAP